MILKDKRLSHLQQEAGKNFSLYHVKPIPGKTDPLGNPWLEDYRRYYASAEMERRCCFCGSIIPKGPVRQIPHKGYTSVYGGRLPYWRYCDSCRRISETRIEDLKLFPTCHPEAYVFLCREYEAEKERIEKHERMLADIRAKALEKERSKATEAERKQDILRRMDPFLKKHGGNPDSAKMILSCAKDMHHLDVGFYLTRLEATEDSIVIYENGGAHSFFDDGGGETWHYEWKIRYVDENDIPEEERGRIKEAGATGEIRETSGGENYFRNPFGLSGVFATRYISNHEYTD